MSAKVKILYAEDDRFNRMVVERCFLKLSAEVDLAEDGEQALSLCRSKQYDLVMLDLHMPKKSGVEVLVEAKPLQAGARFAAITSDDEQRDALLSAGFDTVRIKPVPMADYEGLLKEFGLIR